MLLFGTVEAVVTFPFLLLSLLEEGESYLERRL
jgi:hypothetical protein